MLLILTVKKDHPILGLPWYFIHPCQTEQVMNNIFGCDKTKPSPASYILQWLSIYGQMVGLCLPLDSASVLGNMC